MLVMVLKLKVCMTVAVKPMPICTFNISNFDNHSIDNTNTNLTVNTTDTDANAANVNDTNATNINTSSSNVSLHWTDETQLDVL